MKKERLTPFFGAVGEGQYQSEAEKGLPEADVKARTHLKELSNPNGNNAKDWALVDMGMATFEGIGLRYLRNPDMDFDSICEVLAERIYMPREKLKQRLKELEAKQG